MSIFLYLKVPSTAWRSLKELKMQLPQVLVFHWPSWDKSILIPNRLTPKCLTLKHLTMVIWNWLCEKTVDSLLNTWFMTIPGNCIYCSMKNTILIYWIPLSRFSALNSCLIRVVSAVSRTVGEIFFVHLKIQSWPLRACLTVSTSTSGRSSARSEKPRTEEEVDVALTVKLQQKLKDTQVAKDKLEKKVEELEASLLKHKTQQTNVADTLKVKRENPARWFDRWHG